jgi:hypothetical protein
MAIPELNDEDVTLITDRDKGLTAADDEFPNAIRAYCCQHIADNVKIKFGKHARDLFWKVAWLGLDSRAVYQGPRGDAKSQLTLLSMWQISVRSSMHFLGFLVVAIHRM